MAADEGLARVEARGTARATPERDYTVKVDAGNLRPGRTYYYAFTAAGERSPIGRTRTTALDPDRLRLASVSCANFPLGYFNVYRVIAERDDIDVVLHLGDYIYASADRVPRDGRAAERALQPPRDAATLSDYRSRYAAYRGDVDLQAVHRQHPFIAVWATTRSQATRGQAARGHTPGTVPRGRRVRRPRTARTWSGCPSASRGTEASISIVASSSAGSRTC
jgi:alkaline phosphatase D